MKNIIAGLVVATIPLVAQARDEIQIAGSSTVLPYAQIVAEEFAAVYPEFKTPVVASGGSSSGLKAFCEGVGTGYIDIANSSRPIRDSERAACAANGVTEIAEVSFGYDGIVFANLIESSDFNFIPAEIYQALAANLFVDGALVANSYTTWDEINSSYDAAAITAYIPGEKHGTREVFEEKVLLVGCKNIGAYDAMIASGIDEDAAEDACIRVRKDGLAVDIDGDYTETLSRITANPEGIGVFGLSFYENNKDAIKVSTIDGVVPSVETISSGEYPVSRPLYFYVKSAHVGTIPGLREYVQFFVSDEMVGPGSRLADYGLVPAPDAERAALQEALF